MRSAGVLMLCLVASVAEAQSEKPTWVGRATCAASTCHGGSPSLGPAWRSSYSTWAALDPHAGAGLLLRDEDSRRIVEQLDREAADSAEAYDNVLRQRCISCHATVAPEQCQPQGKLTDTVLAEGVSCEACHGPASVWLESHYRKDWQGEARFADATGMRNTESILGRAQTCVRCHVGSREEDGLVRDMNHDLIAAGHPALRFDLLIYNENLPHHWNVASETGETFNKSASNVRHVGRAINLATAAALTSQRARDHLRNDSVPWPELADYDCFACHQSLSMQQYRLPPSSDRKSPLHVSDGLPVWNAWHTINQLQLSEGNLQGFSPHASDPQKVIAASERVAKRYREKAQERLADPVTPRDVLKEVRAQLRQRAPVDWHEAAILYLEVDAALRDLARDKATADSAQRLFQKLREVEPLLRFDAERASGQSPAYHSPHRFDAAEFRKAMNAVIAPAGPSAARPTLDRENVSLTRSVTSQP